MRLEGTSSRKRKAKDQLVKADLDHGVEGIDDEIEDHGVVDSACGGGRRAKRLGAPLRFRADHIRSPFWRREETPEDIEQEALFIHISPSPKDIRVSQPIRRRR